jgi:hypothetical protein
MKTRVILVSAVLALLGGCAESSFAQTQTSFSAQMLAANPSVYLNFNDATTSFREQVTGVNFIPSSAGTILAGQAGFDNTQPNNTAAAFSYNAYSYAPNDTLGDFDWSQPASILFHVDRLNWARSGTKVLLSKGNTNGNSHPFWQLYVTMNGAYANFCVEFNGSGGIATPNIEQEITCTAAAVDEPNGYNYDIVVTNDGTGQPNTNGLQLYVNGLSSGNRYINAGGSYAFGGVTVAVGGSGTGYANTTPFNAVGGGTNCTVYGTLNASSGVPTTTSLTFTKNFGCTSLPTIALVPYVVTLSGSGTGYASSTAFTSTGGGTGCSITGTMTSSGGVPASVSIATDTNGCTSAPTIVLTAPTGTGAVLTAAAPTGTGVTLTPAMFGASMSSAATAPMYVSGYWNGTAGNGSSTLTTDPPVLIDEVAVFPAMLTQMQIQSMFYQTKFYQMLLKAIPATPYKLIFDNDGCADADNLYALAVTIGAQRIGYISLAGVVDTASSGVSTAMYRQMLDQAGLAHIPVSVPSQFGVSGALCTTANANTYNAATPQVTTAYPTASSMYRTIFAANPTTPVYIMLAGSFRGVSDLMQSPADSISSLTGAQLVAQNAANGGAIYAQGLGANITVTGDNSLEDWVAGQYVVSHNGAMPIYWYGGIPQNTGPGVLSTRNAKDPLFLFATTAGSDTRQAYDSLPTASFVSSLFAGGVTVAIGGSGTGYANSTAFTSTGGGTTCVVSGTMVSVSGVPSSITYTPGGGSYAGLGSGCTSAPTIVLTAPTGTGVTLTATPTMACGTYTITGASSGSTTTATCSQHYFLPYSFAGAPGNTPLMTWFLNSLIDPPPNGAPRVQ